LLDARRGSGAEECRLYATFAKIPEIYVTYSCNDEILKANASHGPDEFEIFDSVAANIANIRRICSVIDNT